MAKFDGEDFSIYSPLLQGKIFLVGNPFTSALLQMTTEALFICKVNIPNSSYLCSVRLSETGFITEMFEILHLTGL